MSVVALGIAVLAAATLSALSPLPRSLAATVLAGDQLRITAQDGTVLNRSYLGQWNAHDQMALHEIPPALQQAFIRAEDRRFYQHHGADWLARAHALWQNLSAGRQLRGASTISEQVVRMLRPRPRTLWSRWVEGFDAWRYEHRFGKRALLHFYLNQVPYASGRRGVVQAARHYFDRTLDTLSRRETLTLAVLVRAPGKLDLYRSPTATDARVQRLFALMHADGLISGAAEMNDMSQPLRLHRPELDLQAPHFLEHAKSTASAGQPGARELKTTLDAALQQQTQALLSERLQQLATRQVCNGAVLVAEHKTGAIKAYLSSHSEQAGRSECAAASGAKIDAVKAARQPGSTLKPFVYALAMEQGWSAATLIDDAPLAEMVGTGLHAYRNYSRRHYGQLTLREALGNSLNIPSIKALQFVGPARMLERLGALGINDLDAHPDIYGDGLALGNGEVTLLSLVQGYAVLANRGVFQGLHIRQDRSDARPAKVVFDANVSSLIANILSDPEARALEFGRGGVLALPIQTAVKTGTSSDHRDAWAIGFDHKHVVGVWLGNLDGRPMQSISGATGPAMVMRSVFASLHKRHAPNALYLSPELALAKVCVRTDDQGACSRHQEEFLLPGRAAASSSEPMAVAPIPVRRPPRIRLPTPGLQLAMDPRIPQQQQRFGFSLIDDAGVEKVEWLVDGKVANTPYIPGPGPGQTRWLWPMHPGEHTVIARVWVAGNHEPQLTRAIAFEVR